MIQFDAKIQIETDSKECKFGIPNTKAILSNTRDILGFNNARSYPLMLNLRIALVSEFDTISTLTKNSKQKQLLTV